MVPAAAFLVPIILPSLALSVPLRERDTVPANISTPVSSIEESFRDLYAFKTLSQAVVETRNELIDGGCNDIIVIFARGTFEEGNVGDSVGPHFFDELAKLKPGKVSVQGVNNYPATVWDYLGGGSNSGARDMADSAIRAGSQCPTSKIVLSGFSQGAQVAHKAATQLPTSLYPKITAIVVFGDPNNGDSFPGALNLNVKRFCHKGDLICANGLPIPLPPHSTYSEDTPEAAAFIATKA